MDTISATGNPPRSDSKPSEEAGLEVGASVGRFVIVKLIGSGGAGLVYAAHDPRLDRNIALKLLRLRPSRSTRANQRLLREAKAIARLAHPNVIGIYDVSSVDDRIVLAMELCAGTLAEWLAQAQRSRHEILELMV